MSRNSIELIRKATIYATDESGKRNGHVYEISSNGPGLTFYEVTGTIKLDGLKSGALFPVLRAIVIEFFVCMFFCFLRCQLRLTQSHRVMFHFCLNVPT